MKFVIVAAEQAGSGTWTTTTASKATGAKALHESSTSIWVAFNVVTEEVWREEGIAELITEEHHEYTHTLRQDVSRTYKYNTLESPDMPY